MHEQNLAIIKGLVCVAWADGKVTSEEMQVIEGLLAAYGATPSEAHEVRLFAKTPKTLDDVPLTDLSAADRRMLLDQAVLVTYVDGEQHERELRLLEALGERLRIPRAEAEAILASGEANARSVLPLLGSA